jgi:hypothetical protein
MAARLYSEFSPGQSLGTLPGDSVFLKVHTTLFFFRIVLAVLGPLIFHES